MPYAQDISGTEPWIEIGTITHVDRQKFTVDWESDSNDRKMFGIPIMSPMFSQDYGSGQSGLPSIGAKAVMCLPSDRSTPFILGFLADQEEPPQDGEDASQAGGRKPTQAEEIWSVHGQGGSMLALYRDGTVMIQAKPGVHRVYIPGGTLWDLASAYKMDTASGRWEWKAEETSHQSQFVATFKDFSSSAQATVGVRIGNIPDAAVVGPASMEVVVAPQGVDEHGRSSAQSFVFRVDQQGNTWEMQQASMTKIVNGNVTLTVSNKTETVTGNLTLTVAGTETETVTGAAMKTALNITMNALSSFQVNAPIARFGVAAADPVVKGVELVQWLATHTHPAPKVPPVEQIQNLPTILSTGVFVER